ncbi:hypothetical protein B0T26DRAFT_678026 [Lasiosphaeria miniovina]|uniref:LTD domain-containing protein n=1 Tax=Lasiosphaeria miniovina TaxID=1954250 RepID=A0AA40AD77_9PEZI|nr:uncharacterized protein B0T26DRAFT_678026 [Lasiosphaeria miniovina]KAK0713727.1 hypothetical protein B0T26DRAFT_678026 [Lasiosphaeria miniovina]
MPIPRYGVWKGTATKWDGRQKPGHGHITFTDGKSSGLDAAVNIQSESQDKRLVYWLLRDFDQTHPVAQKLATLDPGFYAQQGPNSLGLDFLRGNFLDVHKGILVSNQSQAEKLQAERSHGSEASREEGAAAAATTGGPHDILGYLNPILNRAVAEGADMYIYGQKYPASSKLQGIHDIHMNQGNAGQWKGDNGTYQDGGIIVAFSDHWEGIFLAFAVQTYQTDDGGQPIGQTFAQLLSGQTDPGTETPPAPPAGDDDDDDDGTRPQPPSRPLTVSIQAALVNPVGPDEAAAAHGQGETVYLLNRGDQPVALEGWTIANGAGQAQTLRAVQVPAHSKRAIAVPAVPLSNKGGSITLRDAHGKLVHAVSYSKEQARKEGVLVYFEQQGVRG